MIKAITSKAFRLKTLRQLILDPRAILTFTEKIGENLIRTI